jgi:hypothetical protein
VKTPAVPRESSELHVISGTGQLGAAVAHELLAQGKRVRTVSRSGGGAMPKGVEVVGADASDPADARTACRGADVVYHCAVPPYTRWPELFPALSTGILEGPASAAARLVYADNLYAYGLVSPALREMREVYYQFARPFVVDHTKYARAFGAEVTPHADAVSRTMAWYRERLRARDTVAQTA